nr:hypothetical protein [Tanacetum cinerariifolium]
MHGHGHPELAKKLNDKIPRTMDEMFERIRAFIKGEVATGSVEMVRPSQGDKSDPLESIDGRARHTRRNNRMRSSPRDPRGRRKFVRNHVRRLHQKPQCQHRVKNQKVQDSDDRFLKRNISSSGSNRSSSNYEKGRKK